MNNPSIHAARFWQCAVAICFVLASSLLVGMPALGQQRAGRASDAAVGKRPGEVSRLHEPVGFDDPSADLISYEQVYAVSADQPSLLAPSASPRPDIEALAARLEAAEAEIRALRAAGGSAAEDGSAIFSGYATAPKDKAKDPIAVLEQKWADFLKKNGEVKYPNVQVHGVFQADAGMYDRRRILLTHGLNPLANPLEDGANFRRARLSANGAVSETVNYFFQMDFAFFGRPTFTDVWVEQTNLPLLGNVRIGQWKQPFGLEVVSSFRYTTFMERSTLFQAFTPFRHMGVGFYDHSDDLEWTWAASYFRTGQDQFGDSISNVGGNGGSCRLTHCPFYDEAADGRYYLHLGAGYFFNAPPFNATRIRSIPEFFVGEVGAAPVGTSGQGGPGGTANGTPFFVDTGVLGLNNYQVLGTELLWVNGPISLQAEGMLTVLDQQAGIPLSRNPAGGPMAWLGGAYAQVGYFLTGEHRPYDRKAGAIDRIKPFENFFRISTCDGTCTGWGAWEIAARVSYIDLDYANIHGGRMTDVTAGLNWYWNPNCKMVFNYIESFLQDPTYGRQNTGIFAARAQLDF